ncbi:Oleosin 14.9 kDa [Linum perenne]
MDQIQPHHQTHGSTTMQQHQQPPMAHQAVKAVTAATAGGTLMVLSGLVLVATVISLIIATPLFVIFSPVLVPALITVGMLITGFLTSGGFGVAAVTVLSWIYR